METLTQAIWATTARGIDELLALIPELLGFHPTESVVSVVLQDGMIAVAARMDFPTPGSNHQFRATWQSLRRIWGQYDQANGFLIGYTQTLNPWSQLWELASQIWASPLWVIHVGNRFWQLGGSEGMCRNYSYEAAISQNKAVYQSRAALARTLHPISDDATLKTQLSDQLRLLEKIPEERWPSQLLELLKGAKSAKRVTPEDAARTAALIQFPQPRGAAISFVNSANAAAMRAFWSEVVKQTPQSHQLRPLSLLGLAAWISGDGALAVICLERAAELLKLEFQDLVYAYPKRDPKVPVLIGMLAWINYTVTDPERWEQILAQLPGIGHLVS
ncbi:MAG: DUF4192 domain-containing protein [Propionibacteriaceae bacterium]|nr:DUF4192 domain-containing protein [Propionibacteriaceae bacterium]